jgi:hypothetical protein
MRARDFRDGQARFAESAEASVTGLVRTKMFPVQISDIGEGGDTQWNTEASYGIALCAPKPDLHFGYATGQSSNWSPKENATADHVFARPYTQPVYSPSLFLSSNLRRLEVRYFMQRTRRREVDRIVLVDCYGYLNRQTKPDLCP